MLVRQTHAHQVCPAPAGMSPNEAPMTQDKVGLPRTCEDEPTSARMAELITLSAPHLRG